MSWVVWNYEYVYVDYGCMGIQFWSRTFRYMVWKPLSRVWFGLETPKLISG